MAARVPIFLDREDAGRQLANALSESRLPVDALVLGLPRGGVVVAAKISEALRLPLDVFVVRKLGLPGHEELAMGAIATGGVTLLNRKLVRDEGLSDAEVERVIYTERDELARRERLFRGGRPPLDVRGRTVVIVDDGLATGSTMRAAVAALRREGPRRIVMAVPVSSTDALADLMSRVEETVCLATPEPMHAIGEWYQVFEQTSDAEVTACLARRAPTGAVRDEPRRA